MSVAILYHPGLGTAANSDLCGARAPLMALADSYGVHPIVMTWDDPACMGVLLTLVRHNSHVFLLGHSHGAWRARENYNFLAYQNLPTKIGLAFIDLCPWMNPFENAGPPEDFPINVGAGVAVWQSHVRPFMPKGVKFKLQADPLVNVLDCTPLTAPPLGHVHWQTLFCPTLESIAGDARVWALIGKTFATLVSPAATRIDAHVSEPLVPPDAGASHDGAPAPTLTGGDN